MLFPSKVKPTTTSGANSNNTSVFISWLLPSSLTLPFEILSRVFFEEIYFKLGKPTRLFSSPRASKDGICVVEVTTILFNGMRSTAS